MTSLLFVFLAATLISQSFMDIMSVVVVIFMLTMRLNGKTIFSPITSLKHKYAEAFFLLSWLTTVLIGLWNSPRTLEYFAEWKWILNLYFLYWFLNFYFHQLSHSFAQKSALAGMTSTTSEFDQILPSKSFWQPLHWILLACFAYGIISYFLGIDLFKRTPLSDEGRFGGPFDDPMNFAHLYGMYFIFFSVFGVESFNSIKNFVFDRKTLLLWMVLLTTALSLYLSLTRGAWVGVFVALVVLFFIQSWRLGLTMFSAGLVTALLLYSTSSTFKARVDQAIHPTQSYDSERVQLWRTNWAIFLDHPIVGIGHGDYKRFLPEYFAKLGIRADHFQSHAHNQYLQFLSNTGILGLLFYLSFIFYIMVKTYKGYTQSRNIVLLGCLGAQIAFHIGSLTECNFERAKVRLVYLFFCALAMSVISYQNRPQT